MGIETATDRPYEHAYPTPAQHRILRLIAKGQRDREIAAILGLSPNTVRTQVGSMLQRIGASSRSEAVNIAWEQGWLP